MQFLKADTAVKIVIGPCVAVGDGFTPVTTLALGTADEAELIKHDAATATDISGNTLAAFTPTAADGYYNLTLTAGQLDTEGMLTVLINDDSLCLPLRHDFMVVNANVYDSLYAPATTAFLQVDVKRLSGSTQSADDLQDFADEGYDPSTNKVQGVVLTDTTTALTNDLSKYAGPRGPGVYLNDAAANTNTVDYTDGTIANPVSTPGAAKAIADSLSLDRIYLVNDSQVTLSADVSDFEFVGIGDRGANVMTLGGQVTSNAQFYNLAITGAQSATSGRMELHGCAIQSATAINAIMTDCAISGDITLDASVDVFMHNCWSAVTGNGTPAITFAGGCDLTVRNYSGSMQFVSMAAGETAHFEGFGQLLVAASCTGGIIDIRGCISLIDSSGGAVTIGKTARIAGDTINEQADQALTDYGANTTTPPTAAAIVNEWETQSQADPTGFHVNVIEVGGVAEDIATETKQDTIDTVVDAIKAKTDDLTFTKAKELDSNVQSINGVTITGDGSATPFDV